MSAFKLPHLNRILGQTFVWGLLTTGLLFWSHLYRDLREPYAEDGSALILGGLSSPLNLVKPVVDGVFIIPRLFGTIAVWIDLAYAPVLLSFLSAATIALVAIYAVRYCLGTIAPLLIQRFMIAAVIVGGIGSIEVTGFAMCVSYVLTVFLVLLALEERPLSSRYLIPLVLLLALSTNSSFVAAPVFFVRAFITRNRVLLICGLLTLAPLPIILSLATESRSPHSLVHFRGMGEHLEAIVDRVTFYLFVVPLSSDHLEGLSLSWRIGVALISALLFLLLWFKSDQEARFLSLGLAAAAIVYISAHAFGRAYPIPGAISEFRVAANRFAFILVPCAFMAWSTLICNQRGLSGKTKNILVGLMLVAQIATTIRYPRPPTPPQTDGSWARFASELTEARKAPPGKPITDTGIYPRRSNNDLWGLIHCDTTDPRFIRCTDLRGNKEGATYDIPRLSAHSSPLPVGGAGLS